MDERWTFFTVDLELTNICRQNCRFCPRERMTRPAGFIDTDLFARIAGQLALNGSRVTFCGMGNPLLHPNLADISMICREAGLYYGLTIQAPALSESGLRKIELLRPAFIEVSFPSLDPALFSNLYPGEKIENSLAGLHNLVKLRDGTRGLVVNVIKVAGETMPDPEIVAGWHAMGFECRLQMCHSRGGNLIDKSLVNTESRQIAKCGLFAAHSFITWQGKLLACCHDLTGETMIADLSELSVAAAAQKKAGVFSQGMPYSICKACDEPAARRVIPDRPFPASPKARSRYLKNLCRNNSGD